MVATNDARVDTTFIGYLLIGLLLLIFGVMGLQDGGLFGDTFNLEKYKDLPVDYNAFAQIVGIVGLILIVLTIFAYRTGKQGSAGVFALFGASFLFYCHCEYSKNIADILTSNSNWFLYVAIAVFFLIFGIYALVAKTPKFVATLLLLVALMFFFFGLACYFYTNGPGAGNIDSYKAMGIVYGIFGFLGFVVATYLGLAYANPKKIPLV